MWPTCNAPGHENIRLHHSGMIVCNKVQYELAKTTHDEFT